jgi:hypothetical protein
MQLADYLAYLDLSSEADERSVRRAYALKLKKIDQENDPNGFQRLREAYEFILNWVHRRADPGKPLHEAATDRPAETKEQARGVSATESLELQQPALQSSSATKIQIPAWPPHSHEALAQEVLSELTAALPEFSGTTEDMKRLVLAFLEDSKLTNLDARSKFEELIVNWLAQGWKPGNHILFEAAASIFQWEGDRKSLSRFGKIGITLDAACDEWVVFKMLPSTQQVKLNDLISQLRENKMPIMNRMIIDHEAVEKLLTHTPNWLHIVGNVHNAKRWHQKVRSQFEVTISEEPAAVRAIESHRQQQKMTAAPLPAERQNSRRGRWLAVLGLLGLLACAVVVWWRVG